ncbi:rhamnulokinase [Paenibacillus barengoltzii]|uniref:rhamnulokinase n=1 Tax=Paenibacillus barengoltzii TaxID=343517 RepID=UPI002DB69AB1|nr:rhamnulokinase family protein [Paenibacillus barengoltzii]MEC2343012.1 rhamnulokinase [Paenibacillus barengoltzii]
MSSEPQRIPCVLAFDLGASSGRAFIGEIRSESPDDTTGAAAVMPGVRKLHITEIHRFPNVPVQIGGHLHWDTPMLLREIKSGIRKAFQAGYRPESCAIDTWGVDFGLLDRNGELLGIPYHYRDRQTEGLVEEVSALVGAERLFRESGLQFMPFNTLYQLYAMKKAGSPKLDLAETLLLTPDLLSYFLTGQRVCEFTMATTTGLFDPGRGAWNAALMDELGIPSGIFSDPVPPGTVIGELTAEVCAELDVPPIKVVAAASHDTESAAAAVPADTPAFAYLVSGTWSLLGTQMAKPLLTPAVLERQFSNEGGVDGTYHLLKNIMGLWILQECKRKWEQAGEAYTYAELVEMAEQAEPLRSLIDPDDLRFMNPADMPEEIRAYCRDTGQPVPDSPGAFARCILESLALRYRQVLEQAEELTGSRFTGLHMVGGGTQNELLCRLTAEAIGRPVWAGPVEASAIGNLLVQLRTGGWLHDLQEGLEMVKASFPIQVYEPEQATRPEDEKRSALWAAAYERFERLGRSIPC